MLLLAGLGNPGPKYQAHRHNIGFMAAQALAGRWGIGSAREKFQSLVQEARIGPAERPALVLRPMTFMNESGRAVAEAAKFYKIAIADIVVFYDELDLAPGRFRMKAGGGAAGHNGIRSIIAHLGPEFRRARLGIGHPGDRDRVLGHVLGDFAKSEQDSIARLCAAIAEAAPLLAAGEDDKFQAEIARLAPAPKFNPRQQASRPSDMDGGEA